MKKKSVFCYVFFLSVANMTLNFGAPGRSELFAGCLGCTSSSDKERYLVYETLKTWCESHVPGVVRLPTYRQSRKLMSKLKKENPLSPSEKGGLWIRRLVKQNIGLTNQVAKEILSEERIRDSRFADIPEFISAFGILASTRIGFTVYYPELAWPED